jgi:hypothetical protein
VKEKGEVKEGEGQGEGQGQGEGEPCDSEEVVTNQVKTLQKPSYGPYGKTKR